MQLIYTTMENLLKLVLTVVSLLTIMPGSQSEPQMFKICLENGRPVARFSFYVHDVFAGDDQSAYIVAKANTTEVLPSGFGLVFVLDDRVTYEPEYESEQLGRLQGMAALSDLNVTSLDMMLNLVFTQGKYNGSTLNIFGRNPLQEEVREISIVGGTGAFRMARGYITITTYAVEVVGIHVVYQYNFTVYDLVDPTKV